MGTLVPLSGHSDSGTKTPPSSGATIDPRSVRSSDGEVSKIDVLSDKVDALVETVRALAEVGTLFSPSRLPRLIDFSFKPERCPVEA